MFGYKYFAWTVHHHAIFGTLFSSLFSKTGEISGLILTSSEFSKFYSLVQWHKNQNHQERFESKGHVTQRIASHVAINFLEIVMNYF